MTNDQLKEKIIEEIEDVAGECQDFFLNDRLDETLQRYFQSYAVTVDTLDYVPERHVHKIHAFIFRNLKGDFKTIKRSVRRHKREVRRELRRNKRHCGKEKRLQSVLKTLKK